jgi:hypothetical protein
VLAWVGSESPGWPGAAVVFVAAWGATEEAQVAVCGALQWGQWGAGDVCGRISGVDSVYAAAASVLLATIITGAIYGRTSRHR